VGNSARIMKGIKVTTTTEVPLVDDVIYSVSNEVCCDWLGCNKKKLASEFDSVFFTSDCVADSNWTKYVETIPNAMIFNTEAEAIRFKESNSFVIRIDAGVSGNYIVRFWSQQVNYYCSVHSCNCNNCDELLPRCNSTMVGDYYYCDDCRDNEFSYCDNCSEYVESVSEVEGDYYCSHCIDSIGASWCDYCDMFERNLCDANYDPDDVDIWSSSDYDGIMNYSFKPRRPDFFMGSADSNDSRLFYGMELEVESMENSFSDGMKVVKDSLGEFVYFKADGSLDRGYELVTYPFSFNYYSEAIDFKFLSGLQELGYRSWSAGTCGLHVHISRTGFASSGHIWKFAQLILSNQYAWSKLAGRTSSRWASFDSETNGIMKVLKGEKFPERYCAVNLSNTDTVEVRIFRGSLNERRVRSAIESIDCAIQYAGTLSVHDINQGALKFGRFADWVNENRTECASFIDLMCEYGLIPSVKTAEPVEPEDLFGTESIAHAVLMSEVVDNLQGSESVLTTDVEN
jgi:hypothetical protein